MASRLPKFELKSIVLPRLEKLEQIIRIKGLRGLQKCWWATVERCRYRVCNLDELPPLMYALNCKVEHYSLQSDLLQVKIICISNSKVNKIYFFALLVVLQDSSKLTLSTLLTVIVGEEQTTVDVTNNDGARLDTSPYL